MRKVALRGIRANLGRSIMAIVAVVLGVAFMTGTLGLSASLDATFQGIADTWNHYEALVVGANETSAHGRNHISADLREQIMAVEGVADTATAGTVPLVLIGADRTPVQSTMAPSMAMSALAAESSGEVTDGRLPERPGEMAVEASTLASSGLAVGDTATVILSGQNQDKTIVGEVTLPNPQAGATMVFLEPAFADNLVVVDGLVPHFAVWGEPGVGEEVLVERIASALAGAYPPIEVQAGEYVRELNREAVAEIVGMIGTFMTLFAGLALFIGGFIIANTFTMSVQQQVQELALLRTMGASPAQVFGSIMLRASAVGLLGSLIGVAAGAGLLALITSALEGMGMELGSSALIDPGTAVTALVAGVLVTVLAALLPARRAAAVPPLEAMRAEGTTAAKPLRKRAIIGGAITALAAICLVTAWAWPETEAAEPALLVGALLALVGALVLMSVIAGRVTAFLAAPFVALLRPMGRLARGNVQRNPRRTAATGGALMIGSALLGLVSVLITSIGASALASVDEEVHADLVMTVPGFVPQAPAGGLAAVSALPGVEQVHSAPGTFAALVGQDGEANPVMVLGLYSNELLRPQLEQGEFGPSGWLADGEVIINSHHYHFHEYGLAVGDTLTLRGPAGEQEVTLVGVFAEGVFNLPVMANQNTLATLAPAQLWMDGPLAIRVAPGFDVADVQAAAQEAVEPYFVFSIHTRQEFIDSFRAGIDQILTVFYALLGLSLLIAGIGVINTMAMSVMERTREIGLLRAVGLGRGQLRLTVTIESVLTALFGTLLGLGLGVGIALLFPRVLGELGLSAANVPWGNLGVMLIVAVVVGVLAAAWPARRAARLPVLDAISHA